MEHSRSRAGGVLGGGFVLFLMVPLLGCAAAKPPSAHPRREIPKATNSQVLETYGKLPLTFEANQGQTDSQVRFLSRGRGYTLFLTPTEAVLALREPQAQAQPGGSPKSPLAQPDGRSPEKTSGTVLRMQLVGANPAPRVTGLGELPGKVNSFTGNDPTRWRTNVPTYSKVEYEQVYPGVNLVYYGNQRQLEYDFVVSPGADPRAITLAFEGMDGVAIDALGDLVLRAGAGEVRLRKPVVYQDHDGHRTIIPTRYVMKGERQVAFEVAAYDGTQPLIIDPVLAYSTYLGGGISAESGHSIAVDRAGNAYVTGFTSSLDFPQAFPTTPGAFQDTLRGFRDAFVAKLNADGSGLVYSTYLGGSGGETGVSIAVDAGGNAYVTGNTDSMDFPTTQGAFQSTTFRNTLSGQDAFVAKFNAAGALVYSTYLHGTTHNDTDWASGIAADGAGNAYVTGFTFSQDFPTTLGAFQETLVTVFSVPAFVTKLNADGSALVYSTYLRGAQFEFSGDFKTSGIAVDGAGNAHVTGLTTSTHFPTTLGAFQSELRGSQDAFVAKLNSTGSALVYSTYLGGIGSDSAQGIAVDASGNAYVTGTTGATGFTDTTDRAIDFGGTSVNGFVTKFDSSGALAYVTYLRGASSVATVSAAAPAVDGAGSVYLTGFTNSTTFPTTPDAVQPTFGGGEGDAFVAKLNATGTALLYSSYLGGGQGGVRYDFFDLDGGGGIAVDDAGNAYVTGVTDSVYFPTTPGAFRIHPGISSDAFVTKLSFANTNTPVGENIIVALGNQGEVTLTFANVTLAGDTTLTLIPRTLGPDPPAGFRLVTPEVYYDLTTTAEFSGSVMICINHGISSGDTSPLQLFHRENGHWMDKTFSLDRVNNVICATTTSLSPFAVVEQANRPPVANAGADRAVQCNGHAGTPVTLDGSGSTDPDGDTLSFEWLDAAGNVIGKSAGVNVSPRPGAHTFTVRVNDGKGGTASDEAVLTVQDTTPPQAVARLVRITRSHDRDDDRDADDEDDAVDDDKALFRVVASATDACHSSPGVQADINGVTVVDGQLVRVKLDDDKEKVRFRDGLLRINASVIILTVRATDGSGNTASATAKLAGEHERQRRDQGDRAGYKPAKGWRRR